MSQSNKAASSKGPTLFDLWDTWWLIAAALGLPANHSDNLGKSASWFLCVSALPALGGFVASWFLMNLSVGWKENASIWRKWLIAGDKVQDFYILGFSGPPFKLHRMWWVKSYTDTTGDQNHSLENASVLNFLRCFCNEPIRWCF